MRIKTSNSATHRSSLDCCILQPMTFVTYNYVKVGLLDHFVSSYKHFIRNDEYWVDGCLCVLLQLTHTSHKSVFIKSQISKFQ